MVITKRHILEKYFDSGKPLTWYIKPTEHLNGLSPNLRCYNQCKFPNINYISFELLAKFLLVNLPLNVESILNPHICQKEPFQVIFDFIDFPLFSLHRFCAWLLLVGCAFKLTSKATNYKNQWTWNYWPSDFI